LECEQVKRRDTKPEGENTRHPRRKSIHRRAEILHHARRLFEQAGFHETSFDDIARAVGIRREGLYYYYRSRADILLDLVRPQNEALVERLTAITAARLPPAAKLYLAIKGHLAMFDRLGLDMVMLGIGRAKVPAGDPEVDSVHAANRPLYRSYQDLWVKLIREGQRDGTFDPGVDAKLAVFAILGMCNWTGAWLDPNGPRSIRDIVGTFYAMVGGGLVVNEEEGVSEAMLREAEAFEASLSE
jgi:TetR/AcrR family transcriptional regulator, cholesterol catabolism regulator